MIYIDLILNLTLLISISIISGFIEKRWSRQTRLGRLLQGALFGSASVLGMMKPLNIGPGVFLDGRSIMISLCAMFFGSMAGCVATSMTVLCRIGMGGSGTLTGTAVIVSSLAIGLAANSRFKPATNPPSSGMLFSIGILVHLAMLALMFTLPEGTGLSVVKSMGIPIMLLFPLATVLAGTMLSDQVSAIRLLTDLQKTTRKLAITLQSIGDAVLSTNEKGEVVLMNPVAEALTGWSQNEASGRPVAEVFHVVNEATRAEVENPVARVLKEGIIIGFSNHTLLIARDGTERPVAESGAPIRDEDGNITGVVLVFRDQSEERLGQKVLQESELLFRKLFENHAAVKLIIDPDSGSIIDANRASEGFYGWSQAQLRKMNIAEINELPFQQLKLEMAKVQVSDQGYFEFRHRRADGSVRDVEVFASRIEVKGKSLIHSIVHDATERKQAEAQRTRLLSALEQAGEMIIITDLDGIIQYVNPAFEQGTGYSSQEVTGQNPRLLKSGKQPDTFYKELWETISGGGLFKGRIINKRKDGSLYTEEATISPVRDHSGRIVNYVAVKHDITEQIQLESQIRQAQKMESVGRLAGGVAHDFNNMLSVIIGYTELALNKVSNSDPLHSDLKEILNAARRSTEITRQLLAFARKQTISPKVIDLNEIVEGMLKMIRRLIGEDINLVWLPEKELPAVKIDQTQIEQVLANLCVNARDAINGIGKITIETRAVNFDESFCAMHEDHMPGQFIMLSVSDDGCGMDKKTLESAFEPFFTTKGLNQGTGLGLATVFGILKQNNGFVNVHSEKSNGTTFRIYLPVTEDKPENVSTEAIANTVEPTDGQMVMMVEDEPVIRDIGQRMLERLGFQVILAESPRDALKLADEFAGKISLVITDVVMPEMNGRDLANNLLASYPDIKILFMSGYTANVIADRGVLEEGLHFIQKPFSMKELSDKVHEALSGKTCAQKGAETKPS